ncbi:DUF3592 domain-containing protein [Microlunatus sp. GCM10028923]|uniref:DUF3592 domain-containing protein n=1 Tax=Microlunatus sp. GCM10028923 TaxID=3273400 RepID=UPI003616F18B
MPTDSGARRPIPWIGLIFGSAGLILLVIGAALGGNTISFLGNSTVTTGTVVDNKERTSCSQSSRDRTETCSTQDHAVVVFTTAEGEEIRFTSTTGTSPPMYRVGDRVPVRYPPDRPRDATIDGFLELWLGALITTGLGVVFGAIGTGLLISHRRDSRG